MSIQGIVRNKQKILRIWKDIELHSLHNILPKRALKGRLSDVKLS